MLRALSVLALVMGLAAAPARGQEKLPTSWDGPCCRPVARELGHEFAREPAVRRVGPDRYEITFATRTRCDVAVAIEDAAGRIVRHIVYGVLGSNAPAPLQKDSLEQTLYWDGKDEVGKYVQDPEQCRVRVSLGLKPTFDKIIGWHPKDTSFRRYIPAIAADADGVYVFECPQFGFPNIRHYDHDANYVKTVYPWDPEKLDQVVIPKRTLPDAQIWRDRPPPAGSRHVPLLVHYGGTEPVSSVEDPTCMAIAAGKIALFTNSHGRARQLLRLRTDGTTGGESIYGGLFTPADTAVPSFAGQAHIALSPDGKWVYVTGLGRAGQGLGNRRDLRRERPPYTWNAVFRFAWDDTGVVIEGRDSFVGEVSRNAKTCGAGDDNDHLDAPQGLACDAVGRLYVADHNNHRIQVFSPEGKYLRTIAVQEPQEIALHPRTGEIYVLCFRRNASDGVDKGAPITLLKLGPLDNPVERMRQVFAALIQGDPREFGYPIPLLAVDGWAAETRVWLLHESGVVRVFAERGGKWELFDDFEADVRRDGFTPHCMHGKKMGYLNVDPVRGHVYRISTRTIHKQRIDPEEGKTWQELKFDYRLPPVEEAVIGWDGYLYVRGLKYLARFDPGKFPASGPIDLNAGNERPFDYGEEMQVADRKAGEVPALLRGVIRIPWAMGGANGYNNGLGVSARGDILVLSENYQNLADLLADFKRSGGTRPEGAFEGILRRGAEDLKEDGRYRPGQYPGRPGSGNLVWRWDRQGQLVSADAIPGLPAHSSFGIRADPAGNIIVGVGYHQNVDGRPHIGGSVAKFAAQGGRLLSDQAPLKPASLPDRPPDYLGHGRIWAQNLFWSVPGLDQLHFVDPYGTGYPCQCYHCKFDTDPYGRTFIPRAYGYHVLVVDSNGNRICEIGRFGNADRPAMKPGDTDIGLGQCSYLATVSDKWLYIADDSNLRILRVKLGYQAEKRLSIPR